MRSCSSPSILMQLSQSVKIGQQTKISAFLLYAVVRLQVEMDYSDGSARLGTLQPKPQPPNPLPNCAGTTALTPHSQPDTLLHRATSKQPRAAATPPGATHAACGRQLLQGVLGVLPRNTHKPAHAVDWSQVESETPHTLHDAPVRCAGVTVGALKMPHTHTSTLST
jgi:hypothetical protein